MFATPRLLPAFVLLAAFWTASPSQAQTSSVPLYTTSYSVQVEWYFWRSGGTYWANEYETSDLGEAQLVFELFESALESGTLCEILGGNITTWIPVDVRLKTNYHWNVFATENRYVGSSNWYLQSQ